MHHNYFVYPEGKKQLEETGLLNLIKTCMKGDNSPYIGGHVMDFELRDQAKYMAKEGFKFPKEFKNQLNLLFQLKGSWKTKNETEAVNLQDVQNIIGWWASFVLKPEEFNPENFGYPALSQLTGTIGAMMWELQNKEGLWKGKSWQRGNTYNIISGDTNCDLLVIQTDKTPYETIDPLGNPVLYRPVLDSDENFISAAHSTEPQLLAILMKYAKESKLLNNKGKELIEYAKSIAKSGLETCAEHHSPNYMHPGIYLNVLDTPIPEINDEQWLISPYQIGTQSEGAYCAYLQEGELVFRYLTVKGKEIKKGPAGVRFGQEDVDDALKSLLHQSAKFIGRTSLEQLVDVVKYRYSSEFEKDMKEYKQ